MILDEIEKITNAATEGPWEWTGHTVDNDNGRIVTTDGSYSETGNNQKADGEFIAMARSEMPKLIAIAKLMKESIPDIENTHVDLWAIHFAEALEELEKD